MGTQGTQFASSLMRHACWTTQQKLSFAEAQTPAHPGREMIPSTLVSMAMGVTSPAADEPRATGAVLILRL